MLLCISSFTSLFFFYPLYIFFLFFYFIFLFCFFFFFFFQAEDGIRDHCVTGVQTCALPISGMTGGMAFVYDAAGEFPRYVNPDSVVWQRIDSLYWEDEAKSLIEEQDRKSVV